VKLHVSILPTLWHKAQIRFWTIFGLKETIHFTNKIVSNSINAYNKKFCPFFYIIIKLCTEHQKDLRKFTCPKAIHTMLWKLSPGAVDLHWSFLSQFHHHFTREFFVQKQIEQLFSNYVQLCNFLAPKFCTKNARIKHWWNRHLVLCIV